MNFKFTTLALNKIVKIKIDCDKILCEFSLNKTLKFLLKKLIKINAK